MKKTLKDYLNFTREEQRGALVLLAVLMALSILNPLVPVIYPEKEDKSEIYGRELDSLFALLHSPIPVNSEIADEKKEQTVSNATDAVPFFFDPNTLDKKGWKMMGLPDKLIGTILKYCEKGGSFYSAEDLKKIYGFKDEYYKRVAPYVQIMSKAQSDIQKDIEVDKGAMPRVGETVDSNWFIELNTADTADLIRCRGIGPYYASKIIRYRELLGGYAGKEQLLEIRGIDTARYVLFSDHLTVDTSLVVRIDLNEVGFKDLLRHPYFSYEMVKAIFDFRRIHGRFDSAGQLRQVPLIGAEGYPHIADYVSACSTP